MEFIILIGIFLSLITLLVRACITKNIYERLLIANSFSTQIVLVISLFTFYNNSPAMIDIALIYTFLSFLATIGFAYYFAKNLP